MSIALRLNEALVHDAEAEGLALKRTAPKQVEYWAEIGKAVAHRLNQQELLALLQGVANLRVEPVTAAPVDPGEIFAEVERQRADGTLAQAVTRATTLYEASTAHPGMIDRIQSDGNRESGQFKDGRFVPLR